MGCTDHQASHAAGYVSGSQFKAWNSSLNWLQGRQHTLLVGNGPDKTKTISGDSTVQDEGKNVQNTENKRLKASR